MMLDKNIQNYDSCGTDPENTISTKILMCGYLHSNLNTEPIINLINAFEDINCCMHNYFINAMLMCGY